AGSVFTATVSTPFRSLSYRAPTTLPPAPPTPTTVIRGSTASSKRALITSLTLSLGIISGGLRDPDPPRGIEGGQRCRPRRRCASHPFCQASYASHFREAPLRSSSSVGASARSGRDRP